MNWRAWKEIVYPHKESVKKQQEETNAAQEPHTQVSNRSDEAVLLLERKQMGRGAAGRVMDRICNDDNSIDNNETEEQHDSQLEKNKSENEQSRSSENEQH